MKQLVATARNISHVLDSQESKKLKPAIEAILTFGEKCPVLVGETIGREMRLSEVRFEMDIEQAIRLRKNIDEWIDSAKKESKIVSKANVGPTAASETSE